jgi:TetR/AcrR family transcriptional repressor of mexJK operon
MAVAVRATRGEKRRARRVQAARAVFLERGFEGATLDQVIAVSGGSRATLYEQFGDKEGLFAAIVGEICDDIQAPLAGGIGSDRDPTTALQAFARRFMRRLMEPESLALYRLVIAESRRLPELGRRVFTAGPERAAQALGDYLRAQGRAGTLRVRDPELSARIFLEMIKGDLHTRALFGAGKPPSAGEIEATVREAVRLFFSGLRAG